MSTRDSTIFAPSHGSVLSWSASGSSRNRIEVSSDCSNGPRCKHEEHLPMIKLFSALLVVFWMSAAVARAGQAASTRVSTAHPLDSLSAAEIRLAVAVVRKHPDVPASALFPVISLHEPAKAVVAAFRPGAPITREAFVVVFDRPTNRTFEAIVNLSKRSVTSMTHVDGAQPALTFQEMDRVPAIVRANEAWRAAMRKRGLTNFAQIHVDPWAPGLLDPKTEPRTTRWARALSYLKGTNNNVYARPIEGVVALVDLNKMQVERVIDAESTPLPVPPQSADLDPRSIGRQRVAPKPLRHVQPLGPSFTIHGQEVRWQKWRFRVSVHPREGLVLHTVGYEDGGQVRSVLYRASLSEMVVPYADPSAAWQFRNAFDEGEYGIGRLTNALEIGTDAPRHARFLNAVYGDDEGKPVRVPQAVAIYERDGGVLWKHFEYYSNTTESRRARELVVFSLVTVGNYDYGFNWVFKQDGSIEMQAVLTGIMLARGLPITSAAESHNGVVGAMDGRFWHLVAPNVAAPHHQHFLNMRLDFDVDGAGNAVREINTRSLPAGAENPGKGAFVMDETVLRNEHDARRDVDLASARRWLVVNPAKHNALGQPTGYLLHPGENSVPYLLPDSEIRRRADFVNHHFWATQFHPSELHAAGDYPNQSLPGEGLMKWTAANRPLEGQDVVVWYTFGITHVPRPEEWPVMTATLAGFKLLPASFFSRNPALDVPK
jgi:primary-amine oxidase